MLKYMFPNDTIRNTLSIDKVPLRVFTIFLFFHYSSFHFVKLLRDTGEECSSHSVPRTHLRYTLVAQKKIEVLRKNDNFKIGEM